MSKLGVADYIRQAGMFVNVTRLDPSHFPVMESLPLADFVVGRTRIRHQGIYHMHGFRLSIPTIFADRVFAQAVRDYKLQSRVKRRVESADNLQVQLLLLRSTPMLWAIGGDNTVTLTNNHRHIDREHMLINLADPTADEQLRAAFEAWLHNAGVI